MNGLTVQIEHCITSQDSAVQRTLEYWEAVSEEDDDWLHLLQELEFFTRFTLLTGSEYVILFPVLPVVKLHPNGSLDMEHIAPVVKMEEGEPLLAAHTCPRYDIAV